MIAAALEPIPRAKVISLSIVIRKGGSGRFRCAATLLATRRIRLSEVAGIDAASTPRTTISCLTASQGPLPLGEAAAKRRVRVSISTFTLKYRSNANPKASKPAPKLDVLAGTRSEERRVGKES